jgi:hypothetical protein
MRMTVIPLALLLVCLLTGDATAQTSPGEANAPGVTVVKKSWQTRVSGYNVNSGSMNASQDYIEAERIRKEIQAENDRTGVRGTTVVQVVRFRAPQRGATAVDHFFEAEIKNAGTKKIRWLAWEYRLFHEDRQIEVRFQPFATTVKINPGKGAKVRGSLTQYVATLSEAKEAAKQFQGNYREQVIIHRIEYDDGSVWERPSD